MLHNGLGNYDDALAAAAPPCEYDELAYSSIALPELIEAAVRAGQPDRAAVAVEQLSSRARASGTQWALGLEARSRALTSTGPAAEDLYHEAIQRLGDCRMATHLARAHLVYGEWLRRQGRRQDAREQLRTAHERLSGMGAEAFAARAARELRATGERPRKRTVIWAFCQSYSGRSAAVDVSGMPSGRWAICRTPDGCHARAQPPCASPKGDPLVVRSPVASRSHVTRRRFNTATSRSADRIRRLR